MKIALVTALLVIAVFTNQNNTVINSNRLHTPANPFIGNWGWSPDKSQAFSLDIKQVGNKLVGSYCDVFDYGKKMDCTDGEDRSFTIPIPYTNSVIAPFISTYSHAKGKVQLTLSGNKLIWNVIKRPKGENYCPDFVVMKKD